MNLSLTISGFGPFREPQTIRLGTLTLISGENAVGKTWIAKACAAVHAGLRRRPAPLPYGRTIDSVVVVASEHVQFTMIGWPDALYLLEIRFHRHDAQPLTEAEAALLDAPLNSISGVEWLDADHHEVERHVGGFAFGRADVAVSSDRISLVVEDDYPNGAKSDDPFDSHNPFLRGLEAMAAGLHEGVRITVRGKSTELTEESHPVLFDRLAELARLVLHARCLPNETVRPAHIVGNPAALEQLLERGLRDPEALRVESESDSAMLHGLAIDDLMAMAGQPYRLIWKLAPTVELGDERTLEQLAKGESGAEDFAAMARRLMGARRTCRFQNIYTTVEHVPGDIGPSTASIVTSLVAIRAAASAFQAGVFLDGVVGRAPYARSALQVGVFLEEPEVFLHPPAIAVIGEALGRAHPFLAESGSFALVETHSEVLLRQVHRFVERGVIQPSGVALNAVELAPAGVGRELSAALRDESARLHGASGAAGSRVVEVPLAGDWSDVIHAWPTRMFSGRTWGV